MKLCRMGSVVLFALLGALACNYSPPPPSEVAPGLVNTWAKNTLDAMRYMTASISTLTPTQTPSPAGTAILPVDTILDAPSTPTIAQTSTPVPSLTPLYPTFIVSPDYSLSKTASLPAKTAKPGTLVPCNSARYVGDVTIPDGFTLPVGLPFTKVWRIQNNGSCTWDTQYKMVFISGDRMKGITTALPKSVKPNETIDIPVNLVTPIEKGIYRGNWLLQVGETAFGDGSEGTRPFFVQIEAIPNSKNIVYNFAANFCAARWESGSGDLICPGKEGDPNGFVTMLHKAWLETRSENEPTLWMQPNERDGWISGVFPAIEIQHGYHFQADIGCLAGYEKCNVNFELWYRLPNSPKKKIGTWQEYHDSHLTRINIDLSPLAGSKASFTLLVIANSNPDQAAAFWLMPQIIIP